MSSIDWRKVNFYHFVNCLQGDSGSPLVYQEDIAVGIMSSSGTYCNENELPGIYTSITSHLTFIKNALKGITTNMRVHRY